MKLEFYNTIIEYKNELKFTFGILPSLCISENAIWFHWLLWGINIEYR